ncbi:flagellar assembly protein FliW [Thermaerobacillus caldiproteolyticus]|uniref:Flagellar assembly factor FliW n=1 Tax=Thermaerobacillus caldiproteolyticus TaxID=247480 RepID=A0A7V9Z5X7_9BACL|nr:flagellar assembly protein FliW [Anoxybacillus caldiproteolyticus]MBA2874624.1 flagellar assembly factor FliW [Anoxybacillus caldiproteolyticus]QPA30714.1 flagellar assembly protein FliW [Anoxybacillus caldiproteolyticus]
MKITSKFLGEIEINEEQIIYFPNGLPGFEDEKQFVILPLEKESPFAILQSVQHSHVGFVVAYPFSFHPDYAFDLAEEDIEKLKLSSPDDCVTYTIMTLKEPFANSTMNLKAPIIINAKAKIGKQLILHDSDYPIRFPLSEVHKKEAK